MSRRGPAVPGTGRTCAKAGRYDPLLPSYDVLNLRVGVRRQKWDLSLYANNVTDERALLAFDRERGTRARIFYLTNQPRAVGIETRVEF